MRAATFIFRVLVYFLCLSSTLGIDCGDTKLTHEGHNPYASFSSGSSGGNNQDSATLRLPRGEALVALNELKNQGVKAEDLTYVVRGINFTHLANGRPVLRHMAPMANAAGKMLFPLQHHEVFFTLKGSTATLSSDLRTYNASDASGRRLTKDEGATTKVIKVHLQLDGIYMNVYDEMPPVKSWHWSIVSETDLDSIIDFVADDGHSKYEFMWWNCQQFAYGLVSSLAETCREAKRGNCIPEDLEAHLPLLIYEGKLWYVMLLLNAVGTCAIGLVTLRILWWAGRPLALRAPKGEPLLGDA